MVDPLGLKREFCVKEDIVELIWNYFTDVRENFPLGAVEGKLGEKLDPLGLKGTFISNEKVVVTFPFFINLQD